MYPCLDAWGEVSCCVVYHGCNDLGVIAIGQVGIPTATTFSPTKALQHSQIQTTNLEMHKLYILKMYIKTQLYISFNCTQSFYLRMISD